MQSIEIEGARLPSLRYDYDTEVRRLGDFLDKLGIGSCNLFGHDYGGFLALGLALRRPELVRRLAILNSRAHRTFTPRWALTFGLWSLAGRTPGLRALEKLLARPARRAGRAAQEGDSQCH